MENAWQSISQTPGTRRAGFSASWLPVLFGLTVIAAESTRIAGSAHTMHLLAIVVNRLQLQAYVPNVYLTNHDLRKLGHFIGYGLLALAMLRGLLQLLLRGSSRSWSGAAPFAAFMAVLGDALVASLDEWHQSFLPGRNACISDVCLDTMGAATFVVVTLLFLSCTSKFSRFHQAFSRSIPQDF